MIADGLLYIFIPGAVLCEKKDSVINDVLEDLLWTDHHFSSTTLLYLVQ